jgi:hypothetical protein
MKTSINSSQITPWYRQRWPWLIMAGPFLVALAASYTFWLAASHPDALVVGDYYRRGQAINIDLRRDRLAAELGLRVNLRFNAALGQLSGNVMGPAASIGKVLHVHLIHATLPAKDLDLDVVPDLQGYFTLALTFLERARWQVVVESDQGEWRLAGVWSWPQQHSIVLMAESASPN